MNSRLPPRYLPTLTEVVQPHALIKPVVAEARTDSQGPALAVAESQSAPWQAQALPAEQPAAVNRQVLAQQILQQVRPKLEAELRNIAQELFEAQFSALLPSLHMQIEEAVREAIEQALPDLQRFSD
jgi:hypothetical protein